MPDNQPEGGLGSAPAWGDDLNPVGGYIPAVAPRISAHACRGSQPSCPSGLVCWGRMPASAVVGLRSLELVEAGFYEVLCQMV